jgi:hypothetical protein
MNFKLRSKVESDGGDAFSSAMISNFLYGRLDGSQIEEVMDEIKHYNVLRTWSRKQWSDIIDKYVYVYDSRSPCVTSVTYSGTSSIPNGLSFAESLPRQWQNALRRRRRPATRNRRRPWVLKV